MVRGLSVAVSCQPDVRQWAEMHRIKRGGCERASNSLPRECQLWRHWLSSIAFIRLPWPTNSTGMRSVAGRSLQGVAASGDVSGMG